MHTNRSRVALFAAGALFSLSSLATPALALGAGILLALSLGNPWPRETGAASSGLLQASVVGLGFGIPLDALLRAGAEGMGYTLLLIVVVLAAGLQLGRWLATDRTLSMLIAAGTSICGGSAIAAVGPAIGASRDAMSISLATVFILNAVALYVFPPIGHLLELSQHQFGVWAALAIHDTSSVVGAAATFGPIALRDATVLKLARALWILPLVLLAPLLMRRPVTPRPGRRLPIPWFIGLFALAAVARSLGPAAATPWFDATAAASRTVLVLTLFLIGTGLTRGQLRAVGFGPLLQGTLLWLAVAAVTLLAVLWRA